MIDGAFLHTLLVYEVLPSVGNARFRLWLSCVVDGAGIVVVGVDQQTEMNKKDGRSNINVSLKRVKYKIYLRWRQLSFQLLVTG